MTLRYAPTMPKIYRKGVNLMKTMIYLDEKVHEKLRNMAHRQRVSMAELIRRAVDEYLKKLKKGGK